MLSYGLLEDSYQRAEPAKVQTRTKVAGAMLAALAGIGAYTYQRNAGQGATLNLAASAWVEPNMEMAAYAPKPT